MRRRRIFGHPVHPIVTDVPIAVLPLALLWQILGLAQGSDFWWRAGFWTLIVGLVAAVVAATSGFVDYLSLDPKGDAFRVATTHMMVMLGAVILIAGSAVLQGGPAAPAGNAAVLAIGTGVLGTIGLGIGGWFGGELVFAKGVGVGESGPAVSRRATPGGMRADRVE